MHTIHTTIISGFLAVVLLCGGGGATKAYTPDEDNKILVHHPADKIIAAINPVTS